MENIQQFPIYSTFPKTWQFKQESLSINYKIILNQNIKIRMYLVDDYSALIYSLFDTIQHFSICLHH